jgi:hypothetical protein
MFSLYFSHLKAGTYRRRRLIAGGSPLIMQENTSNRFTTGSKISKEKRRMSWIGGKEFRPVRSGDSASFTVRGSMQTGMEATGSMRMVLENGQWKVSEDRWQIVQE